MQFTALMEFFKFLATLLIKKTMGKINLREVLTNILCYG